MTVKVNYDTKTTLVLGYYPDLINYASIPEPFIEIEDSEQDNSRQMCVIDGVYQEYIEPMSEQLEKAKSFKISVIKTNRDIFLNSNITVSTGTYKGTQTAKNLFCNAVNGRTAAQYPLNWRLSDDVTWVSLSKDEAYELYDAFEAQEASGYTQETNFIIQVNNATTLEEINSIVIEFK